MIHSVLSPSASHRWLACPGSVHLSRGIEDRSSPQADLGSAAHELLSICIEEMSEPEDHRGRLLFNDRHLVDDDMIAAVEKALRYVLEEADDQLAANEEVELLSEVRADLTHYGIEGMEGGTSDIVIRCVDGGKLKKLIIMDYKHGEGVDVYAERNTQLMMYALGAMGDETPPSVEMHIIQPRCFRRSGPTDHWRTTGRALRKWAEEELLPKARAAMTENAELNATEAGCRFCPAAAKCPKLYEHTQKMAELEFSYLDAKQMIWVLENADAVMRFISSIKETVKNEMLAGSTDYEAHLKLVHQTTRRRFTSEAEKHLHEELGDDIYVSRLKGLGELEKLLKDRLGSTGEAKAFMADVTHKPEPQKIVVSLSDRREPVEPDVTSDFKDLIETT